MIKSQYTCILCSCTKVLGKSEWPICWLQSMFIGVDGTIFALVTAKNNHVVYHTNFIKAIFNLF